ncbi:MAG: hypothetical protein AAB975_00795, partial [Patescibacteria group bacterium]
MLYYPSYKETSYFSSYPIMRYNGRMVTERKNIIIVGAGFGGITAMRLLAKKLPPHFSLIL